MGRAARQNGSAHSDGAISAGTLRAPTGLELLWPLNQLRWVETSSFLKGRFNYGLHRWPMVLPVPPQHAILTH
jgi:hypothetical protein